MFFIHSYAVILIKITLINNSLNNAFLITIESLLPPRNFKHLRLKQKRKERRKKKYNSVEKKEIFKKISTAYTIFYCLGVGSGRIQDVIDCHRHVDLLNS